MCADGIVYLYDYEKFMDVWNKVLKKLKERIHDLDVEKLKDLPKNYMVVINDKPIIVRYIPYGTEEEETHDWVMCNLSEIKKHRDIYFELLYNIPSAVLGFVKVWT